MNFGLYVSEQEAFRILDRALELGVNLIDTANTYGGSSGLGRAEEMIGKWLSQGGGRRERIVLATKVYTPVGDGPNDRGLSAYHIRRACEDSLRRLQTDHIDLYQMHHVDRSVPWEEIWQAMEQLVREGKVIYVGSSNFAAWQIAVAQCEAQKRNLLGLISEQSLYNLTNRMVELEVIPACQALGIGFLAYSPLAAGLLAGSSHASPEGRRARERRFESSLRLREKVLRYEELCRQVGEEPACVALAWLLHRPGVTAPVIGPRTVEQLEQSMRALELQLCKEVLHELDEIWPGPGGPAPEAYAW
jgi:aryl-alcohol dehydrogenase-like predicted oxidoreductase